MVHSQFCRRCVKSFHQMSSLKLFAYRGSQPSRAVEWILKMKQLPYEFHNINIAEGGARTPEYLARYPKGGVPVIQEGDFVLGESHAIMTYLADKHEWTDLYPRDLAQRAKINEYLHWHHQHTRKTTTQILFPYLFKLMGNASEEHLKLFATRAQTLEAFLPVIEQSLDKTGFLTGTESPTIADISCYCELDQMKLLGLYEFAQFPNTRNWLEAMEKLPFHEELHTELKSVFDKLKANENESPN